MSFLYRKQTEKNDLQSSYFSIFGTKDVIYWHKRRAEKPPDNLERERSKVPGYNF